MNNIYTYAIIYLCILALTSIICLAMLYNIFYSLKPHSTIQNATGKLLHLTCNQTEIVYYRYIPSIFGTRSVKTIEKYADYELEECIR